MTHVSTTKALLAAGAVAGPLTVAAFLIEGATRAGYDALRHPISALSLGEFGWMQIANFLVTGGLVIMFAAGLWRVLRQRGSAVWGALFIGWAGVGLIGAGIFATDPVNGYPPGTPSQLAEPTMQSTMHDLFSAGVFIGLPVACFIFARLFAKWHKKGWAAYSILSGILMILFFMLAAGGFSGQPDMVAVSGLFQRLSIIAGFAWLCALAIYFLRGARQDPAI